MDPIFKDTLTVIKERKSVRNYTGTLIRKDEVDQLLRAAMAAPAALG